ncbi:serine hydrolase domain-containing protein [Aquimarina sp. 2201CG1-2-11]|uniref:serine hydrolase domain-containing protein n=1 Tax=Aquimarina discodermiae TaxID=3231043 RepID=UPI0034629BE1
MKKIITFILVLFFIIACNDDDNNINTNNNALSLKLEAALKDSELAGFSVTVVNSNKVIYQNSFGYESIVKNEKYGSHTIQNIASISKTLIGLAIMKAVEIGKLDLDTDINSYLPFTVVSPHHPDKKITIRHLATHTSGIIDGEMYFRSYVFENPDEVDTSLYPTDIQPIMGFVKTNVKIDESAFLKNILSTSGDWYTMDNFTEDVPGGRYQYSNIAATLAAFVVECATGVTYEEFTNTHIFEPLQMNATGWGFDDVNMKNFAELYYDKEFVVPQYSLVTKADGGLITSPSDFSKYLMEMMKGFKGSGTLLSSHSYKEMFRTQAKNNEEQNMYKGLFWDINENGVIGHTGGDPGVITMCAFDPVKNRGYYFVTNMSDDFIEIGDTIDKIWNIVINQKLN